MKVTDSCFGTFFPLHIQRDFVVLHARDVQRQGCTGGDGLAVDGQTFRDFEARLLVVDVDQQCCGGGHRFQQQLVLNLALLKNQVLRRRVHVELNRGFAQQLTYFCFSERNSLVRHAFLIGSQQGERHVGQGIVITGVGVFRLWRRTRRGRGEGVGVGQLGGALHTGLGGWRGFVAFGHRTGLCNLVQRLQDLLHALAAGVELAHHVLDLLAQAKTGALYWFRLQGFHVQAGQTEAAVFHGLEDAHTLDRVRRQTLFAVGKAHRTVGLRHGQQGALGQDELLSIGRGQQQVQINRFNFADVCGVDGQCEGQGAFALALRFNDLHGGFGRWVWAAHGVLKPCRWWSMRAFVCRAFGSGIRCAAAAR